MSKRFSIKASSFIRLLSLLKPHIFLFLGGMLALGLGSGVNLVFPQVVRYVLNSPDYTAILEHPLRLGLIFFTLFAFQGVCFYLRSYIFGVVGQTVVAKLRENLYQAILTRDIEFFDRSRVGDLLSRLSSDAFVLQEAVSIKLSVLIRYSLQVIVGVVLMCTISMHLAVVLLLILPLLVGTSVFFGRKLKAVSRQQQQEIGESTAIAEESIGAIRLVKAFGQEIFEVMRFNKSQSKVLDSGIKRSKWVAFFSSFVNFLLNVCLLGVILYGLHLVLENNLSAGDLTAFLLYGTIVAVSFAFLVGSVAELTQSVAASERLFEIIDQDRPIEMLKGSVGPVLNSPLSIIFQQVCFSYPVRPEQVVLEDLSFQIKAGERVALVGPSGAGKTTVVQLLLGFYKSFSGTILLDGKSMKEWDTGDILPRIAYVPQEPQLFRLSIEDNLRYGKLTATREEMEIVCDRVNILEFINGLPKGFATDLGEKGGQISTGQKQRLSIARALLREPSLLIMDEATSGLDSENEFFVQEALRKWYSSLTLIMVTHRLSTAQCMDLVLVMKDGRVVQKGKHEILSNESGVYKDLLA